MALVAPRFVLDDNADARNLFRVILEDSGYEVEAHGDPREALLRMRAGSAPELVITDLKMPHMNGRELLEALGAHAYLANHPDARGDRLRRRPDPARQSDLA